jgi:hypothetical protein
VQKSWTAHAASHPTAPTAAAAAAITIITSIMATPSFFHGLDALAEKIQSHQLQHAADSIDAATAVKVASRRLNSTFQSTLGQQKKDRQISKLFCIFFALCSVNYLEFTEQSTSFV